VAARRVVLEGDVQSAAPFRLPVRTRCPQRGACAAEDAALAAKAMPSLHFWREIARPHS
jgi:hypothetical protein